MRRYKVKSIVKLSNEYVIKTVKKHEIKMKKAHRFYIAKSDKRLQTYLKEKGIL